jgi:hypothetical protein
MPDIQAILTVLGRRTRIFRKGEEQRLDLSRRAPLGAVLREAQLQGVDLTGANLEGARDSTVEQLASVKTLHDAHLDPPLLEQIRQQYPQLLESLTSERPYSDPSIPRATMSASGNRW